MADTLARAVERHAQEAVTDTTVPRLSLIAVDQMQQPGSLLYQPMICFVASGAKQVDFGQRRVVAERGHMMFNALAVPVLATLRETPYRAATMQLDPEPLRSLLLEVPAGEPESGPMNADAGTQATSPMSPALIDAVTRWVGLLDAPDDIPVMAHRVESEILYRLLCSSLGPALRQFVVEDSGQARIRAVANWLITNYEHPVRIDVLAKMAHMSVATLHRQFRAATGMSPIAFHKQVRLQNARRLLIGDDVSAAKVAHAVGYTSPTQFSREYRREYGASPRQDAVRMRRQWSGSTDTPAGLATGAGRADS